MICEAFVVSGKRCKMTVFQLRYPKENKWHVAHNFKQRKLSQVDMDTHYPITRKISYSHLQWTTTGPWADLFQIDTSWTSSNNPLVFSGVSWSIHVVYQKWRNWRVSLPRDISNCEKNQLLHATLWWRHWCDVKLALTDLTVKCSNFFIPVTLIMMSSYDKRSLTSKGRYWAHFWKKQKFCFKSQQN